MKLSSIFTHFALMSDGEIKQAINNLASAMSLKSERDVCVVQLASNLILFCVCRVINICSER